MGYHDNDPPAPQVEEPLTSVASRILGVANDLLAVAVRCVGIVMMVMGLWIAYDVVVEAWALYNEPARIEPLADAMAKGTNIDAAILSAAGGDSDADTAPRISYALAWFFAPILLFPAGYLAMLAVRVGGSLALGRTERRG